MRPRALSAALLALLCSVAALAQTPARVTFEPVYAPGARPGATAELSALEDTERLARYDAGGSSDPDHPARDPAFHPAPRVVVTLTQLLPRPRKAPPLQAHARRNGYWPIRACYEPGLRRHQDLSGKTRLRVTLGARGSVLGARRLSGDLGDAEVARCLVSAFRKLRFPAPGRKVDADWEIALYPGDMPVPDLPVSPASAAAKLPAPAAALDAALLPRREALASCLVAARRRDPELWGRLAVELTLTASGTVSRVAEVESNFADGYATACVERQLAVVLFPAPATAGARIIVALRLEPAQPPPAPPAPPAGVPLAPASAGVPPAPPAPGAPPPPSQAPSDSSAVKSLPSTIGTQ
jgi:hypothetical protein